MKIEKIAVFCGSSAGYSPAYVKAAKMLADELLAQKITLVYGGASVGLMGILADHMLQHDGQVVGVITRSLIEVEIAHEGLADLRVVNSMHERKATIAKEADGFVMLPGGPGSLEEFFEIFTWGQLSLHKKPFRILNIENYYDDLLRFLDHVVKEGFLKHEHHHMMKVSQSPLELLESFREYEAPVLGKWIQSLLQKK